MNKRNLCLQINIDAFREFATHGESFVELLCTEVELWSKHFQHRTLHEIQLLHPLRHLAPEECIQLLHFIARHCKIDTHNKNFSYVFGLDELTNENIALMRGLHFTCGKIAIDLDEIDSLSDYTDIIQRTKASTQCLGIHLNHLHAIQEICSSIKQLTHMCQPNSLTVGHLLSPIEIFNHTPSNLQAPLSTKDIVSLGPEASSNIGDHKIQNFSCIERYKNALNAKLLPITPNSGLDFSVSGSTL